MKKNTFTIFLKRFRHSFANIGSDADKDWKIVLSLFILASILSVLLHVNLYITIGVEGDEVLEKTTVSPINTKVLEEMMIKYDNRAEEFQSIVENKKTLIDPAQ